MKFLSYVIVLATTLSSLTTAAAATDVTLEQEVDAVIEDVIRWRRDFHQHAELSNREFRTAKVIAKHLRKLGLEVTTGVAKTGVVGLLKGGAPGPVLALRADMDGLPVVERTGLPYASKQRSEYEGREVGVMHACGHDNHMAILMGAAEILAGMREELPGAVKFIFQPAEEGAPKGEEGGAKLMVAEGVLKNPDVDAVIGLHISQGGEVGTASYRSLGFMASAQRFDIKIQGKQTHGARPWAGVDPIVVGAQIVNALQTIVSRQIDITQHPAVVTVGSFAAGVRNNIVPETATLTGTIRTFDAAVRRSIHEKIRSIAQQTATAMGAVATVEIDPGVPVTFNDAALTKQMVPTLERVYGEGAVFESPRVTGAEDFSFYQEQVPGFFFFIGARPPELSAAEAIPNHSPFFYVDENALAPAVRAMTQLAIDYLNAGAR
ncbi:MAG: N-acyl-L-amino acid amidohydrolase [Gammaproteobacteria bacterium]|nr:N-acyl-L-amino acid amidohydrolase [Gammaproteobacteria bacterium]|tara:strand:+ start:2796 stop:4100 length:1305 start_codon:yes stop_codon:yes gene_type:complete